ncbi:MAG: pyridoxal phosphate-dependent aminotransferase [Planctomycetes bacterium]|nr:pyridoxal phosphate-dependent aminotransferase [Planctomycetota bacterium]
MFWAHTQSHRTSHTLSQSGMPPADPGFLEALGHARDLDHPGMAAQPALEAALAERFGVPRERVLVTTGATGGMYLAASRWFRAGARVVTESPSYEPFRALPRFFGADLQVVERRVEDGFALDPERVEAALARGTGPGHVFLSNPNNPSGTALDRATLARLARAAERTGGVLVSCDIYMEYVPPAEALWTHSVAPNAVTIGSFTKAYGLGALRIGWMILGAGLAQERERLVDLTYLTHIDPPTFSMRAALAACGRLPELLAPLRRVTDACRPAWERFLRTADLVQCNVPAHGIIAFPRVVGVEDTLALAEYLVLEHGVDIVPGEYFGRAGHVRVGCGVEPQVLTEGLARLERGIRAFRAQNSR